LRAACSALVLALAAAPVFAQAPQPGPPAAENGRPRDDIGKMIDAYVISNLQEGLGLNDEQFVKLLPLVKRLQSDRRALAQRRQRTVGELRRLLQSGTATDARVSELLRELKAVETEEPAVIRRDRDALDAALTPVQQAKYRLMEVELDRRLRDLVSQARRNAADPPRARRERPLPR
jgi:Spy/CpxP family protein refolding chaperone